MSPEQLERIKEHIPTVQDFPVKGIAFKDMNPANADNKSFQAIVDELYEHFKDKGVTKVIGIEARGFITGAALAYKLNAGFIPLRKPGKLPGRVVHVEFEKEYGPDTICLPQGLIDEDDVVLIHDDILATGGTIKAACSLVEQFKHKKILLSFVASIGICDPKSLPYKSDILLDL